MLLIQNYKRALNLSSYGQLEENDIQCLGSAIANCKKIQTLMLNLIGNQIGESGIQSLSSALSGFVSLSNLKLFLGTNKIGDEGVSQLCSSFRNLSKLSYLQLLLSQKLLSFLIFFYQNFIQVFNLNKIWSFYKIILLHIFFLTQSLKQMLN
ncbi:hypothetical protein ABPG73_008381 [Tetrahymena malaccensis]